MVIVYSIRLAVSALLTLLLSAMVQAGVVHDLGPGAEHVVTPVNAECFENSFASPVVASSQPRTASLNHPFVVHP